MTIAGWEAMSSMVIQLNRAQQTQAATAAFFLAIIKI
jgi:hypothetical protein